MKLTRRFLAVLLAVVMVVCAVPVAAGASIVDSGTCGENLAWTLDSDGALTISGEGWMDNYHYVSITTAPWRQYYKQLETVVIGNNVPYIGDNAFYGCDRLTSVTLGNHVQYIGNSAFGECRSLMIMEIPSSVMGIGNYTFRDCNSLTSFFVDENNLKYASDDNGCLFDKNKTVLFQYPVGNSRTAFTIPDSVTFIGGYAFSWCSSLTSVTIPDSVTSIGDYAFYACGNLTDVYYSGTQAQWNRISIGSSNDSLINARIHYSSTGGTEDPLESISLYYTTDKPLILKNGTSSLLVATITPASAANQIITWTSSDPAVAIINQSGLVTAKREGITFVTAKIGDAKNQKAICKIIVRGYDSGVYSLGEETYCFHNFDDDDGDGLPGGHCPAGGHCGGIALTSSMFHLGLYDKRILGETKESLYDYTLTKEVIKLICHYQIIQGSYLASAVVAGGLFERNSPLPLIIESGNNLHLFMSKTEREWIQVANYVKNHKFDNQGSLIISFSLSYLNDHNQMEYHGHITSFLRYEKTEGEERIYTYDSNAPDEEMYFYKDKNGAIKHSVYSKVYTNFSINSFILIDVEKFFEVAEGFHKTNAIYACNDNIAVENATASLMTNGFEDSRQIMYEIPDDLTQVRIAPLTDHAEFTYMDQVYHIDREDENTIGILKLAESEDDTGTLTIINDPDHHVHIYNVDSFTAPTCSMTGEAICKCTRCGDTVTEAIDSLGHYDNDDDGICDDCGEPMLSEQHTHTYTSALTTAPWCETPGVRTFTCTCGDTYTETIPALGHTDDANDGYCDRCGEMMTGDDHCPQCGKVHNEPLIGWLIGLFHRIIYRLTHLFQPAQ